MDASTISRLAKTSPLLGGLGKLMNLYEATGSIKDFVSYEELDKTIGLSRITLGKLMSSYMEISEVIIAPYKTADNRKGFLGVRPKKQQGSQSTVVKNEVTSEITTKNTHSSPRSPLKNETTSEKSEINLKTYLPATNGSIFEPPNPAELMKDENGNLYYDGYNGFFEPGFGTEKENAKAYKHRDKVLAYSGYLICGRSGKMSVLPPDAPQDVWDVWHKVHKGEI